MAGVKEMSAGIFDLKPPPSRSTLLTHNERFGSKLLGIRSVLEPEAAIEGA